jgi:hypothetical protein
MTASAGGDRTASFSPDGLEFVNWMTADEWCALGRVHGRPVTLVGPLGSGSVVDGSFPLFSSAAFSPGLPISDAANVLGSASESAEGNSFVVVFGGAVRDPILHFHSLGSTVTFPAGTAVQRLSGDEGFVVAGTTVSGGGHGLPDADGSAQVIGQMSTLAFTARNNTSGGSVVDGVYLQIGVWAPA